MLRYPGTKGFETASWMLLLKPFRILFITMVP